MPKITHLSIPTKINKTIYKSNWPDKIVLSSLPILPGGYTNFNIGDAVLSARTLIHGQGEVNMGDAGTIMAPTEQDYKWAVSRNCVINDTCVVKYTFVNFEFGIRFISSSGHTFYVSRNKKCPAGRYWSTEVSPLGRDYKTELNIVLFF